MLGDVLDSVLNIDARILHTLLPLYFRPGKLTLDYFDGKCARYVTPFRLVFFMAILAFFAIQLVLRPDSAHVVQFDTPPVADTSIRTTPAAGSQDTHFADGDIKINDRVVWNRQTKPWRARWLPEFANGWINDAIENARSNLHRLNSGNTAEEKTAARHLLGGMFAVAPQVLFVLLPVFALLLKAFYVFKRRLYMEHLIVAMHSHAFILLSLLVLIALDLLRIQVAPHIVGLGTLLGLLRDAGWVWLVAYLFLMQKRVYGQGWPMTTLKYLLRRRLLWRAGRGRHGVRAGGQPRQFLIADPRPWRLLVAESVAAACRASLGDKRRFGQPDHQHQVEIEPNPARGKPH